MGYLQTFSKILNYSYETKSESKLVTIVLFTRDSVLELIKMSIQNLLPNVTYPFLNHSNLPQAICKYYINFGFLTLLKLLAFSNFVIVDTTMSIYRSKFANYVLFDSHFASKKEIIENLLMHNMANYRF